jgi:hypothetical protein
VLQTCEELWIENQLHGEFEYDPCRENCNDSHRGENEHNFFYLMIELDGKIFSDLLK